MDNENNSLKQIKEAIGLEPIEVKFKKLDENAVIPTYAHVGDVGMDLTAISIEYDEKHDMYIYHTGLTLETDAHYGTLLFPRSSNRKTECYLTNSVGVVDSTIYRGEILLCFKSRTATYVRAKLIAFDVYFQKLSEGLSHEEALKESIEAKNRVFEMTRQFEFAPYKVGDKIAQMVVIPYPNVNLIETEVLSETERGANGFGSTDKKD